MSTMTWNESASSRLKLMWRFGTLRELFLIFLKTIGLFAFFLVFITWLVSKNYEDNSIPFWVALILSGWLAFFITFINILMYLGPFLVDEDIKKIRIGSCDYSSEKIKGYWFVVSIESAPRINLLILDIKKLGVFPIDLPEAVVKKSVKDVFTRMKIAHYGEIQNWNYGDTLPIP